MKYYYIKISSTKILQMKLTRITVTTKHVKLARLYVAWLCVRKDCSHCDSKTQY